LTTAAPPRRFAMVTPNFHPRCCGVGDFTARLSDQLGRRGHEAAIFSRDPVQPHPEAPQVQAYGLAGRLPTAIARQASAAISRYRPTDVVIHYTAQMWDVWRFGSPAQVQLARQARGMGARVVLVAHELYIPYRARADLAVAASLQRLSFGAMLASSDRVFVTTETRAEAIREACRWLGVARPEVVRIGANALPTPRRRVPGPSTPPRIGVFSTAGADKRLDVILGAFAEIARALPGAELVLIGNLGSPEQPLVKKVNDEVARHPARDHIRLTGKLTLTQVAAEIADLDLYLHPMMSGANTRSSTLPTAFGSGLPVVALKGEDTDEIFRDGENLVFAREMSAPAFAAASLALLRDRAASARLAEGARRLYARHLGWDVITDRFLADLARVQ
jgi:glycosyltransferase involved in cell wall biosynthesis